MTDVRGGTRSVGGEGWLRRLFFAQESGLILVIGLVMGALTIFGGTKPAREIVHAPAANVSLEGGTFVVAQADGRTKRYESSAGWERRDSGAEVILSRRTEVNKFLDIENLVLLVKDASFIAIMAVGMTAIIVMGGIDLSVGSIYALAALVGAKALTVLQDHSVLAGLETAPRWQAVALGIGVCCAVGAACGATNGCMIVGLKVHPFIITLGMMAVLRGVVFVMTKGESITGVPASFQNGFFRLPVGRVQPVPVLFMLAVAVAGWVVLTRTVLGRRTYAIGGNETAARYAGVPTGTVKIVVYTLTGLLVGLSACISVGYFGGAAPDAGRGYELDVIAASVIGGASLSGGRGTAFGAVLGAVLIQLIRNAMLILDINQNYTDIVMGAAIVVAVVLDQAKTRLMPTGR